MIPAIIVPEIVRRVWAVVTIAIPVYVGLLIAIALYGWYWHTTQVSSAVAAAKEQLVTAAELESAKSVAATLAKERDYLVQKNTKLVARAAALDEANNRLGAELMAATVENGNLDDALQERAQQRPPEGAACLPDADLIKRLRNAR